MGDKSDLAISTSFSDCSSSNLAIIRSGLFFLDNSIALFHDGPNAAHGARKISKDVERKAIQLTYEPYSTTDGWYGSMRKDIPELLDL